MSSFDFVPAKMSIANLITQDVLEMQFNPTELKEKLSVNWNRVAVLGLSHMPLQYQQTQNHTWDFELAFRAVDRDGDASALIDLAKRFLLALCYSPRGASDVAGGAPPRALFVWPKLASMTCQVTDLEFNHSMFNFGGQSCHFGVKVKIEEVRDARLCMEDVLASGTLRST